MKKHTELKHPGKEVKWKHIVSGGQSSLLSMFTNPIPGKANIVSDSENDVDDNHNLLEGDDNGPSRKRFCSGEEEKNDANDEISSPALDKNDTQKKDPIGGILSDLEEVVHSIKDVKNSFAEMISNFGGMFVQKASIEPQAKEPVPEAEGNDPVAEVSTLFACKDFTKLLQVLPERGYDYDEEVGLVACVICNQTKSVRNIRTRDSKVGVFGFDMEAYQAALELEPNKQPRIFINLKHGILKHERESQLHKSLVEKSACEKREEQIRMSRNEKIGLNLFRIRYNGIMHGSSYQNFEEDVLTANLNGTDTGDINNGREFCRDMSKCIAEVMKEKLADNIAKPLEATKKKRPLGLVADKITPNKTTGHITALILPVPENPLSQPLLNPIMLDLPPVVDHTADGLSDQLLGLMHDAGVEDSQLEGIGVDGQYIKLGAIKKLIGKLSVTGMSEEELLGWIFETWEPAHNLNKADEEIRNLPIFEWLVRFTSDIGDVTRLLGIGKGLEQSKQSAAELEQRLYKLQAYSVTRFASHVEKTYTNAYRSYEIIVRTLQTRAASNDKKVSEAAKELSSKLLTTKFVGTLLGCTDIYRVIATASCDLQQVEQFPWQVLAVLNDVIAKLKKMSTTLKIVPAAEPSTEGEEVEETIEVDGNEWPLLAKHLEELKSGKFKTLAVGAGPARRAGRIRAFLGHENDLLTVQNRLTTLCKYESQHISRRTIENQDHPFPAIISSMEGCFDVQKMIMASRQDEFDLAFYGVDCLEKVLSQASYNQTDSDQIKLEYLLLKERLFDLMFCQEGSNSHILKQYEHLIFKTHVCSSQCSVSSHKNCPNFMKVVEPRCVITMKVLHLFLKFPELYEGLDSVLHLILRCASKTHAEGVAESMGNYVDFYSDKKRGLDITTVGEESYIHWNGPGVHLADALGQAALDKKFGGRSNWRFVTKKGKSESLVVSRLKRIEPRVPFYQ